MSDRNEIRDQIKDNARVLYPNVTQFNTVTTTVRGSNGIAAILMKGPPGEAVEAVRGVAKAALKDALDSLLVATSRKIQAAQAEKGQRRGPEVHDYFSRYGKIGAHHFE